MRRFSRLFVLSVGSVVGACSASSSKDPGSLNNGSDGGIQIDGGGINPDLDGGTGILGDPRTCEEAAAVKAYVGCDFWPTVVANNVWSIFDYAVVVANGGEEEADVQVTGVGGFTRTAKVAPGSLTKIYLPWVSALKGPDTNSCGAATPLTASVRANSGAYHLTSSRPVTVYQFNALEYKGQGGPAGKSWSTCPGNTNCVPPLGAPYKVGCFSFSNDASLLLPSTAMTGNYRVTGIHGWTNATTGTGVLGAYFAVTATRDNTTVNIKVGARGRILAGGGIAATGPGGTVNVSMNAGDVIELVGEAKTTSDLSGSLVTADKPVQVIAGVPCIQAPLGVQACDHVEESVFPAETLGKDYFVTVPTSPNGNVVGSIVRFFGNRDGTTLTYAPSKPAGAPDTLNAGDVVQIETTRDFRVTGSAEFAVGILMLGGERVDPTTESPNQKGDPSMSLATAIEQYRKRYIFLAPDDYDTSFVDIIYPEGTSLSLDGSTPPAGKAIAGGFSITRAKLGPGNAGAHELTATKPVGVQVMGYGSYTSYQYPGGLDLKSIAPPPVK